MAGNPPGSVEARLARDSFLLRTLAKLAEMQKYCSTECMREKVTINDRGVITIPVRLREAFGLKPDDELIAESVVEGILLRPSISVPVEMYTEGRIAEFASDEEALGKLLPPRAVTDAGLL